MEKKINESIQLLKLIADPSRAAILNILAEEDCYVELIAAKLELTPATVCYHLKKLETVGLVKCSRSQFYIIYSLNSDIFDKTLREMLLCGDTTQDKEAQYEQAVIEHFFQYGRLTRIPSQRKKQEIILRELLKHFEKGRNYTEQEVNDIILNFYTDYCTIRRLFIEFGMMKRDHEIYQVTDREQAE